MLNKDNTKNKIIDTKMLLLRYFAIAKINKILSVNLYP